jgi:hypothetical protein
MLDREEGAARKDINFWVERRGRTTGVTKDGRRIYGPDLQEGETYGLFQPRTTP